MQEDMVIQYLRSYATMLGNQFKGGASMYDFILRHGKRYYYAELPKRIKPGIPRHCFDNASKLAARKKYVYVEGVAISKRIPILMHHAWCCLPGDNMVVDPTWCDRASENIEYYGIAFSTETVRKQRKGNCMSILDDYENHWPILRMDDLEAQKLFYKELATSK